MDSDRIKVNVSSEIGKLNTVFVHAPGKEIENMTPENAHKFLYSDILNLNEALSEYRDFKGVLEKVATVYEIQDLLAETLSNIEIKSQLVKSICINEQLESLFDFFISLEANELARVLIEGVEVKEMKERFVMDPLPNLFFMRDASFTMYNNIHLCSMASKVRQRESLILDCIYRNHPRIKAKVLNPISNIGTTEATIEGGDVQIVRENTIFCGCGLRTNRKGIDNLIDQFGQNCDGVKHLIFQELPKHLDSYIHLDMVFTFLDKNKCMAFSPIIFNTNYHTTHIIIEGNRISKILEEDNLFTAMKKLKMDMEPVLCGGNDEYDMAREQWHSGANFFALAPGKVLGYERNTHTIEQLNNHGFEVLKAADVVSGLVNLDDYSKYVITFKGNELSRGGGGARCMTMPICRDEVDW